MQNFTGTVEPMGMSIFMQGSHQLVDDQGEVIVLLQSSDQDLDQYSQKKVKVSGRLSDTVEAGGQILDVTSIELA